MDLSPRIESFGAGNLSWLGSKRGTNECRTGTISRSSLTKATHYADGNLKSGFPVALVAGKYVPYASGGAGGTNVLAGFMLTTQQVRDDSTADIVAPILDSGRIIMAKLPFPVAATATTTGQFVFV